MVPRENTEVGPCEPLVTAFSPTGQHITWCYVCFCFKTPHLIYIVGSLTLNSRPTALSFMRKQILSSTCMFSVSRHSPLALRSTRQHFSSVPGAISHSGITKKYKEADRMELNSLRQSLVFSARAAVRCLVQPQLRVCALDDSHLPCSAHVRVQKRLHECHGH